TYDLDGLNWDFLAILLLWFGFGCDNLRFFLVFGAGEDPKQIGFWPEPSASPVSVGANLFREGFKLLEAFFVEGVELVEEWLVQTEGAFGEFADVAAGEESRSIASIDVPMMLMCSASENGGFVAVG
ncbi:MAG: hypothetical protein Q9175_006081, partial [Cornicularia normoerica]